VSAVAAIYNIPEAESDLLQWSFCHAAHHADINRRIYELTGAVLNSFVLDPFNPLDTGVWSYQHQQMHAEMNAVLGISGFNLLGVDWEDQGIKTGWIFLNAQEHFQAANILGIG
jgi:hypothetical protein